MNQPGSNRPLARFGALVELPTDPRHISQSRPTRAVTDWINRPTPSHTDEPARLGAGDSRSAAMLERSRHRHGTNAAAEVVLLLSRCRRSRRTLARIHAAPMLGQSGVMVATSSLRQLVDELIDRGLVDSPATDWSVILPQELLDVLPVEADRLDRPFEGRQLVRADAGATQAPCVLLSGSINGRVPQSVDRPGFLRG